MTQSGIYRIFQPDTRCQASQKLLILWERVCPKLSEYYKITVREQCRKAQQFYLNCCLPS